MIYLNLINELLLLVSLLLKLAAQAQVGKIKLLINCFYQPHNHMRHGKLKKTNSGKQPTVDSTLEPIQRSGFKYSVRTVIPQSNLNRKERPSKLGRSTPWYFKL